MSKSNAATPLGKLAAHAALFATWVFVAERNAGDVPLSTF